MSRPLTRRLTVLTAVGGCLAAATLPVLAQENVPVSVTTQAAQRQFDVQKLDGTQLTEIDFGPGGQRPFKTVVTDENMIIEGGSGYQVGATMTNLYLLGDGDVVDYGTKIASGDLSLGFANDPLRAGDMTLPVLPSISLSGLLGDCSDTGIADALGITALTQPLQPLLGLADPLLLVLSPLVYDLCLALQEVDPVAGELDTVVDGVLQTVTTAVPLGDLPFALGGATDIGPFTNPSFAAGTVGADDPAPTALEPTTRTIMQGGAGSLTAGLQTLVDELLGTGLDALPATSLDGAGAKTTLENALAGLRTNSELLDVVDALTGLDTSQQLAVVNTLDSLLQGIGLPSLSSVTGQYSAFPVLQATPGAVQPGTYVGTMTVDFFQP